MKWTECIKPNECDKCLQVTFESGEKDVACLNQIYPNNSCVYQGIFSEKGTSVAVSSSRCCSSGKLDDIQVIISCQNFEGNEKRSLKQFSILSC